MYKRQGYTLYADAAFPLIKKQTIPVIIIGAQLLYQGVKMCIRDRPGSLQILPLYGRSVAGGV